MELQALRNDVRTMQNRNRFLDSLGLHKSYPESKADLFNLDATASLYLG